MDMTNGGRRRERWERWEREVGEMGERMRRRDGREVEGEVKEGLVPKLISTLL